MGQIPTIQLGRHTFPAKQEIRWSLTSGTSPFSTTFCFHRDVGEVILREALNGKQEINISFENAFGKKVIIKKLYVTRPIPSNDPRFMEFEVADVRWFLAYGRIIRYYNHTKMGGQKRAIETETVGKLKKLPAVVQDTAIYDNSTLYPSRTLKKGEKKQRWDIGLMIQDVMDYTKACGYPITWKQEDNCFRKYEDVRLENLSPNGMLNVVIDELISNTPSIDCCVDLNGVLVFYDRESGYEETLYRQLLPEEKGSPRIERIDHSLVCPSKVIVRFQYRTELLFRANETGGSVIVDKKPDPLKLENVVQAPDTLSGVEGRTNDLLPGEFESLDKVVTALNRKKTAGTKTISTENIRKGWFNDRMFEHWVRVGQNHELDTNWAAWISELRGSYRQLYRVPEAWRSRMKDPRAFLLSVIDENTGAPSPSPLYANWCMNLSSKGLKAQKGKAVEKYKNITSYNENIKQAKSVPRKMGQVGILDAERGIISIHWGRDQFGLYEALPCFVDNPVTYDVSNLDSPIFSNQKTKSGKSLQLSANHNLATIITATPLANGTESLYEIEIDPRKIKWTNSKKFPNPSGPVMYVDVPASFLLAQVAWSDDKEDDIKALYGIGEKIPDLERILTNKDQLQAVAEAWAYRAIFRYSNRLKGAARGLLQEATPGGAVSSVSYIQETRGKTRVEAILFEEPPMEAFHKLIPKEFRKVLYSHNPLID